MDTLTGTPMLPRTLAAIIEGVARGREHLDRNFVRELCAWLNEHGDRLRLGLVTRLGLSDVVVTLHVRDRVRLVVTGTLDGAPGEVTVGVDERDFPFVEVDLSSHLEAPYTFCTLDFGPRGRSVRLVASSEDVGDPIGTRGRCQVVSTHGDRTFVRVEVEGRVSLWPAEIAAFDDG